MEFPNEPYVPVPINGFEYPSVAEIEAHILERGTSDSNPMRMWVSDQIWTQNTIERGRYGYVQEWPEWAVSLINNAHRPDGTCMTRGRAFQGAVLLSNENRHLVNSRERCLNLR
jgi:hypothetical protein